MTNRQAREELAQYECHLDVSGCPALQWLPAWWDTETMVSLQRTFAWGRPYRAAWDAVIYAAQVNYTRELRRLAADEGRSVRRLPRRAARWPFDVCEPIPAGGLYAAFMRAVERAEIAA